MRQLILVVIFVIVVNVIGAIVRARAQKKEMERRRELAARAGGPARVQQGMMTAGPAGAHLPPPPTGPMGGPLHSRESGRAGVPPARRAPSSGSRGEREAGDRAFPAPRDVAAGRRDDAALRGAARPAGGAGAADRFGGAMEEERLLAGRQAETARRAASRHRVEAENLERNEQIVQRGISERARRDLAARGPEARAAPQPNPFARPGTAESAGAAGGTAAFGGFGSAPARPSSPQGIAGTKPAEPVTAYTQGATAGVHASLLAALRTPSGLRSAILVREILDTPPGLR